jgi:glycerophosphoryl diester phosphodiesterase
MIVAELLKQPRPLLLAHRGNSSAAPENTMPAFLSALAVGVDLIEFDVQAAADGTLIVIHDDTLERTTDSRSVWHEERSPLAARTPAELSQLDAGSWYSPSFAGTRLSTLDQALATLLPQAALMIERKSGTAATLIETLARHRANEHVTVLAFEWPFVAECHAESPDLILGALGEGDLTVERCQQATSIGASIVGWEAARLTAASIAEAHRLGLKVWAWTVDSFAQAEQLLAAGLDGVITNRPASIKPLCHAGR